VLLVASEYGATRLVGSPGSGADDRNTAPHDRVILELSTTSLYQPSSSVASNYPSPTIVDYSIDSLRAICPDIFAVSLTVKRCAELDSTNIDLDYCTGERTIRLDPSASALLVD